MKKHVILIADLRSEFACELNEFLHSAGIAVSTYQFREPIESRDLRANENTNASTVAVVCEVPRHHETAKLYALIDWANKQWAGIPTVACLNAGNPRRARLKHQLKRVGFRAVAESPAQLPALLREVEENPGTDDMPEPLIFSPDENAFALPKATRTQTIRDAFVLIAALHLASNQKEAASIAVDGIARLVFADRWSIFVGDQKSASNDFEPELLATQPSLGGKVEVFENQKLFDSPAGLFPAGASPTILAREALLRVEPLKKANGGNWIAALPLVSGDRVYGVLEGIRRRPEDRSFTRSEIALLNAMTTPIAAALSNSARIAEAERLSLTDELTRLHNARYLRQFLVNEMKRARRFGSKIAALFLDLDDFKTINDLHGHLVGSHALMEIAGVILPSVRDTDCVVRYGGDEFVIILPETAVHEAVRVADRIRTKIERHKFTGGRRLQIRLTSSIGLAVFPDDALSPHQLIACADSAMYAAKAANKNCVRVAKPVDLALSAGRVAEESLDGAQFQRIPDQKFIS
jgi:diguanylate cyclase (GGDEF)-like protein